MQCHNLDDHQTVQRNTYIPLQLSILSIIWILPVTYELSYNFQLVGLAGGSHEYLNPAYGRRVFMAQQEYTQSNGFFIICAKNINCHKDGYHEFFSSPKC